MWTNLLFSGTAAAFLAMTLITLWHLRWFHRLPARDQLPPTNDRARCSVVIAARDEEARIEATIRGLMNHESFSCCAAIVVAPCKPTWEPAQGCSARLVLTQVRIETTDDSVSFAKEW
jgi:hypothetical protein